MRKYLILALMLAALILSAAAKPESFTIGSYKVSFDLNRTEEHKTSIAKPMYSATFNGILYTGYGAQVVQAEPPYYLITVVIMQYKSPIKLGYGDETTKRLLSDNGGCKEVKTAKRIIDGHQGFLTTSSECQNDTEGFVAQCLHDGTSGLGNVECLIASTYPWDEGTSSLLRTIHIEKQAGS